MILYICFILFQILLTASSNNIGIKSGVEEPVANSVGLKFFAEIKNNDIEDSIVEVFPEECCLDSNDNKCNIIEILGEASETVNAGATKTITMVAPLLDQFERNGYCTLFVDSSPISTPKNIARDTVKIKFNTKININSDTSQIRKCKHIDEDYFNGCKPVNCDTHYNGQKSYYSVIKKRCVSIPACLSHNSKVRSGYNPISNKCIDKNPITKIDIEIVKQLAGSDNTKHEKGLMIIKVTSNGDKYENISTIKVSEHDDFKEEDVVTSVKGLNTEEEKSNNISKTLQTKKIDAGDENKIDTENISDEDDNEKSLPLTKPDNLIVVSKCSKLKRFLKYLTTNKYMSAIMGAVILLQCLLIGTMLFCMSKNCCCCKKKQTVQKFFNYRHDASVTTPLIGTSNMDTETTDYQYLSESSNYIDKKIKCYKACQKERKANIKLSMSDDILSKCITRRDWNRLPKSETIPEVKNDEELKTKETQQDQSEQKKPIEVKVNFQEQNTDKKNKTNTKESVTNVEGRTESSEKEIRCHSYENNTALQKSFGIYNQNKSHTDSIEKGAQAYFSNDSIDDFLSERGMIFFGDNASKYSFTSLSSNAKSTASSRSSKTSKNNIVKNVMSLLSKKSKGPASDPGGNQLKADIDLELLHISRASVFTSSNETGVAQDIKRIKESTSSL